MNIESTILMNTQKIEKALIMPERWEIFAQDIVKKLITDCKNLLEEQSATSPTINMDIVVNALSTVLKYTHALNYNIPENKTILEWINNEINLSMFHINRVFNHKIKLYNDINEAELNLVISAEEVELEDQFDSRKYSYEQLRKIATNRHSVRNFLKIPIDYKLIEQAVTIANSLPSACNRQACSLYIINNQKIKDKILSIQCGNSGFSAPIFAAIVCDKTAFTQDNEKNLIHYHGGMFSGGLVLGLEALKLSSCILNWNVTSRQNKKVKNLLKLTDKEIISFIFIGYATPEKEEAYSYKKHSNTLIEFVN